MTDIDRAVVTWDGFAGAPGISVFYALPGGGVAAALRQYFESLKAHFPTIVQIRVPDHGDTLEAETGEIVGSWTSTVNLPVDATGLGGYAAAGGGLSTWVTDGIVNGHRVRGRTFLVPLDGDDYDSAGQLTASFTGTLYASSAALVAAGADHFCIWSRPTPQRAGSAHVVTSFRVPTKMSVLRSRRD